MDGGAGGGRRVIDGRFELVERLGGGGMGLVWRARDVALHREVALKEVRPPDPALLEGNPTAAAMLRERVLREARALARLDHPNVVTIHHIVDAADVPHPWLVMELVKGGSLQDRLARGPLAPREAAAIGRGVLSALRAAHAAGIHHRDVKPANVLLRPDGSPVLTDFGIAALRESTSLTATGELIGSPEYIAPERIRGDEGNPASDLWSLGMLLYVAVEGAHPLRRGTSLATLAAVLGEDVPPPRRSGPLAPVLTAVLDRDPAVRPDAETFDRMLARVETGEAPAGPTDATQPPPHTPAGPTPPPSFGPPPNPDGNPHGPGPATPPTPSTPYPAWQGSPGPAPAPGPGPAPASPSSFNLAPPAPRSRQRTDRRIRAVVVIGSALSTVVAGLGFWALYTASHPGAGPPSASAHTTAPSTGHGTASTGGTGTNEGGASTPSTPSTGTSQAKDLTTPAGIREAIRRLRPVMGSTRVCEFDAGPTQVTAYSPAKADKSVYDEYAYRGGAATRTGPGGPMETEDGVVDLNRFDWDALPKLFKLARQKLNIRKPTEHYVVIEPAWAFAHDQPMMLVYLGDDYGVGYIAADVHGNVFKMFPREKS
jgi:serine/threonine protein kinase